MKILARCSFLLVTMLWGSFYAVAKAALTHVDPIIFTLFEALTLVPIAMTLLIMHRHTLNRAAVKRGLLLGSCLCIATLTITVSEKFTGATNTAFFPSTGGTFAAVITAAVFGRSLAKSIWVACGLSLLGVLLLLHASLSGAELRGDIIALLGALLFTVYLFLVDQDAQHEGQQFWAVVGIEHLSFALWMLLFSLLFGDWQHVHPVFAQDIPAVLYVALACTFLPVILTHVAHRHIDPLETGFISILEPLWGAIIAHVYLGEVVSLSMYVGGGLILTGAVVHLLGASDLAQVYQRVIGLVHRKVNDTSNLLKRWGHMVPTPSSLLCMGRLLVLRFQPAFQVDQYHGDALSELWKGAQLALSRVLSLQFWLPLLANALRWGCIKAIYPFQHQTWRTLYAFPSFPMATLSRRRKARKNIFFSLLQYIPSRSVSSLDGSDLTLLQACSPALVWSRPSQQSLSP